MYHRAVIMEDKPMQHVAFKRWGNSLAIRISRLIAKQLNIDENTKCQVTVENNRIVITPEPDKPTYQLSDLIAQITPENLPEHINFGKLVGKEWI